MNSFTSLSLRQPPRPVVAYQSRSVQIVVVGCGGTGSWLVVHLARLVWDFNRRWEQVHDEEARRASLLLVDHDVVEENNIRARQNFCPAEIGYPKAQLLATRLTCAFGLERDELTAHVGQFSPSLVSQQWGRLIILVGCVDNAKARQELASCLRKTSSAEHPPLFWWIDSGNSLHAGQILCGNVAAEEDLRGSLAGPLCLKLPSPALLHPDLLHARPDEETDDASTHLSCADLVLSGEPAMQQSRTINNHMAALAYGYVEKLVYGGLTTFATYTDNASFTTRSLETTPEDISAALGLPVSFLTTSDTTSNQERDDEDEEEDENDVDDEGV